MSRRTLSLFALVPLLAGCVPVTEPVGDVAKAEPDNRLVGRWQRDTDPTDFYDIDVPAVRGNPRGLMRAVGGEKPDDPTNTFWFHLATVGKSTYATIYLHPTEDIKFADFREEGAFEKYARGEKRRYFVFRYTLDGDKLDVDSGSDAAVRAAMEGDKIAKAGEYYQTPAGWLAKYLEKTGPDKVFDGSVVDHRKRVKK